MEKDRNTTRLESALQRLLGNTRSDWPETYQRDYDYNLRLTQKMLVTLHAQLTADQRAYMQRKLQKLSADLQSLIQNR